MQSHIFSELQSLCFEFFFLVYAELLLFFLVDAVNELHANNHDNSSDEHKTYIEVFDSVAEALRLNGIFSLNKADH